MQEPIQIFENPMNLMVDAMKIVVREKLRVSEHPTYALLADDLYVAERVIRLAQLTKMIVMPSRCDRTFTWSFYGAPRWMGLHVAL